MYFLKQRIVLEVNIGDLLTLFYLLLGHIIYVSITIASYTNILEVHPVASESACFITEYVLDLS